MPTFCAHFKLLKERLDELEGKFIAEQIAAETADPLNFQPDLDKLAAFRLLIHAELEDFLEQKAKENVSAISARLGVGRWMRHSPELLALVLALRKPLPAAEALELGRFEQFIQEVIAGANAAIKDNNGVKSGSFVLLSLCAGKTLDEIDSVLSNSLNSYGKDRGDVAHKSVIRSTSLQAPTSELATAKVLVDQLALYFDVCV